MLAQRRLDDHGARASSTIAATRRVAGAPVARRRAQHAAAGLRGRQVELLRDADRLRDLDVVRAVRAAGVSSNGPCRRGSTRTCATDGAAIVDDHAGRRRPACRCVFFALKYTRAGHAGDEIAALGEQRQRDRLHHDRDALLDRLGDAAVLGEDREQAVAARDRAPAAANFTIALPSLSVLTATRATSTSSSVTSAGQRLARRTPRRSRA